MADGSTYAAKLTLTFTLVAALLASPAAADPCEDVLPFMFANGQGAAAGAQPWSVALADLNADGVLDLVTANPASDDVSVLLGQRKGDCDNNGRLDSCDIADNPTLDCDNNGLIDSCEIAADPALDCDLDGVLDTCQVRSVLDCLFGTLVLPAADCACWDFDADSDVDLDDFADWQRVGQ